MIGGLAERCPALKDVKVSDERASLTESGTDWFPEIACTWLRGPLPATELYADQTVHAVEAPEWLLGPNTAAVVLADGPAHREPGTGLPSPSMTPGSGPNPLTWVPQTARPTIPLTPDVTGHSLSEFMDGHPAPTPLAPDSPAPTGPSHLDWQL